MYHGQRRPATRGNSASTSMVEIATTPPGRSACQIARRSEAGSGRCSMTSQIVTASKVSAGIGASSTAPQKTVPARRAFACSAAQREGSTPATSKPALLGELEEGADVAADVEQLAARREALHVPRGSRRTSRRGPPPPRGSARPRPRRTGPAPSGGAGAGSCTRARSCGTRRSRPCSRRTRCEVDV